MINYQALLRYNASIEAEKRTVTFGKLVNLKHPVQQRSWVVTTGPDGVAHIFEVSRVIQIGWDDSSALESSGIKYNEFAWGTITCDLFPYLTENEMFNKWGEGCGWERAGGDLKHKS